MAIIFVDVFFIYNFIIDLILILTTKLLCFSKSGKLDVLMGAFLGSFYAVCDMVFNINGILSYALQVVVLFLVNLISFKPRTRHSLLKSTIVFFVSNFIYGGACMFLVYFLNIGMHFGGGIFYLEVGFVPLVLWCISTYGVIYFSKRIIEKKLLYSKRIHNLEITVRDKAVSMTALYDTGNCLFEPISGAPVIFAEEKLFEESDIKINSYRAIPYRSAGGDGILMAFLPDKVKLDFKETDKTVYVALFSGTLSKDGEYNAVLHPFLLTESKIKEGALDC